MPLFPFAVRSGRKDYPIRGTLRAMHPIGNKVLWVTLGFLLNLGYACAQDTAPQHRTITHQGEVRNYYVALPADYNTDTTYWPLVVVHGGGGNAEKNTKALALRRQADQEGLPAIVIQPEFITADKQVSRFPSLGESDFLLAVLQAVRGEFKVQEKILLNGYSMGGQFTHRFALAHPELVQACAPFAAGTWSTPDGRLLIESFGAVDDPRAFLSDPKNAQKIPERLGDLFDPRVVKAARVVPGAGADTVPYLVMCGTLDTRMGIAKEFAASLAAAGFTVESAWPATPHGNTKGAYDAEFEKYTAQAIDFFKRHTER